jgi:glycosyltransferase involved in cell wall biosynthesis
VRIAEVASVATPVRSEGSGSIEQVVWSLASGLVRLGHQVTVFGAAGSESPGSLVETLPGPYGAPGVPEEWRVAEWVNVARAVERSGEFDLIHAHGYLYGLPLAGLSRAAMVHTLHVMPPPEAVTLARLYPDQPVTALSGYQWAAFPDVHPVAVIPNGITTEAFTFNDHPADYVAYLGRFADGKGTEIAIRTARAMGLELRLAGWENDYFAQEIAPLVDDDQIRYVGPLTGADRDAFLGGARALLYPVTSHEPFGMVMPEAMLCGTPVAAFRVGAVAEVVDEGITGCTVEVDGDFGGAVRKSLDLDRRVVRDVALASFGSEAMTGRYEALFASIVHRV